MANVKKSSNIETVKSNSKISIIKDMVGKNMTKGGAVACGLGCYNSCFGGGGGRCMGLG